MTPRGRNSPPAKKMAGGILSLALEKPTALTRILPIIYSRQASTPKRLATTQPIAVRFFTCYSSFIMRTIPPNYKTSPLSPILEGGNPENG